MRRLPCFSIMYPERPTRVDAETVLAIHDWFIVHSVPPSMTELAEVMGSTLDTAIQRVRRATMHGWLLRLPRSFRAYIPIWYGQEHRGMLPTRPLGDYHNYRIDDTPLQYTDAFVRRPNETTLKSVTARVTIQEAEEIAWLAGIAGISPAAWMRDLIRRELVEVSQNPNAGTAARASDR